jgi:hypothetical protein
MKRNDLIKELTDCAALREAADNDTDHRETIEYWAATMLREDAVQISLMRDLLTVALDWHWTPANKPRLGLSSKYWPATIGGASAYWKVVREAVAANKGKVE